MFFSDDVVPSITFELRSARTSTLGPSAMVQLLTSLPNPPHQWWRRWHAAPTCSLEILSQGQTIYFLLTVPFVHAEYILSQIMAAYPEVLVQALEHNPLQDFFHPLPKAVGQLRSIGDVHSSLRVQTGTDTDSMASVLAALSKMQDGETAVVQWQIRKVRHADTPVAHVAEGAPQPTPSTQPTFQVAINVLTQAHQAERARQLLDSIATAVSVIQTPQRQIVSNSPWGVFTERVMKRVIHRHTHLSHEHWTAPEIASLYHLPTTVLMGVKNIAWGKSLLGEPPNELPVFSSASEEGRNDLNLFAQAEYKNQEEVFGIKRVDRRRHMYVIGKSGTGKSTLLANMIINDLKHNEGIAVVDPHGELIDTILDYIPKHRINDVIVFDPSDPEAVVKMNLFEGENTVHRELVASGILSMFQKLYADSWGPRLEYILRNALLTLLSRQAKLEDVLRILTDPEFRGRVVAELDDPVLKNFWQNEFDQMQEKLRTESISPILNKVGQFVTSPIIRNVVNTTSSSFSIEKVMNEGKILLVNVSQGRLGEDNAAMLGAMMITKIQLAAMNRVYLPEAERRDFYLYIDEFQNFATSSFVKILSEARKYRLNLILANQYMAQVPDDVKAGIFGNAATMASFILGAQDAEWMVKEFGNTYTQEDLVSLGRYQVILKLMIDGQVSRPFPAKTLSLAKSRNQNRQKVLRVSREQFAKPNKS
jgi:hypothetical protein